MRFWRAGSRTGATCPGTTKRWHVERWNVYRLTLPFRHEGLGGWPGRLHVGRCPGTPEAILSLSDRSAWNERTCGCMETVLLWTNRPPAYCQDQGAIAVGDGHCSGDGSTEIASCTGGRFDRTSEQRVTTPHTPTLPYAHPDSSRDIVHSRHNGECAGTEPPSFAHVFNMRSLGAWKRCEIVVGGFRLGPSVYTFGTVCAQNPLSGPPWRA